MPEDEDQKKPSPRDLERERLHRASDMGRLRERLYARGSESTTGMVRHELGRREENVATRPVAPTFEETQGEIQPSSVLHDEQPVTSTYTNQPLPHEKKKGMSFRAKLLIISFVLFLVTIGVAAVFFFMGNKPVSAGNITVDVIGPLSVGGGDVMTLDVKVQNLNAVPVESATLIVDYPTGAQSLVDSGRELFTERVQLNDIKPNEEIKVPIRMLMFGEENDKKEFQVSVEYRVKGSNATFKKDALPFEFVIGVSPVIINVNAVKSIPTDQETTIELVIQSNTKEPLSDLLLRASYPQGFNYIKSDPDTTSGEDMWKLKNLKPGEEQKVRITGKMTGREDDENEFTFEVGVTNEKDPFDIASSLAKRVHVVTIERPFLDVSVKVNGQKEEPAIIGASESANVIIDFDNTLDNPLYDVKITAELSGNTLDEMSVDANKGFYDSQTNIITWDSVDISELRELPPGEGESVSFTVEPRDDTRLTPEMKLKVNIEGNRVGEDRVPERVVGTVSRNIRVSSATKFTSAVLYTDGPFQNSGPIPPVAEQSTTYTVLFTVKNGTNPVSGAEVTAQIPQYVKWLDATTDTSGVSYSSTNRTVRWNIGELKANEYREVWMQISATPSLSQVGNNVTLMHRQTFRATDRFTQAKIDTLGLELSTDLNQEPNPAYRGGNVREP